MVPTKAFLNSLSFSLVLRAVGKFLLVLSSALFALSSLYRWLSLFVWNL